MRYFYLVLGFALTALGIVGALLPVLPTTPFLLLAAACFARSSPKLERYLLEHSRFGPLLIEWRSRGAIPLKAKWIALAGVIVGFLTFWFGTRAGPVPTVAVAAFMLAGLVFVWTRPTA